MKRAREEINNDTTSLPATNSSSITMEVAVTDEHIRAACDYIGKSILYANSPVSPKQIMVMSDLTYLDKFDEHPLNRSTDQNWVDQMMAQMLGVAMKNEVPILDIAININDIKAYLTAMNEGEEVPIYKAIILDGQHRWKAMQKIKSTMPHVNMNIILHVHVCDDADEIVLTLNAINNRRPFTDDHAEMVNMNKRFHDALDAVVTKKNKNRRCVTKVKSHIKILKSPEFFKKYVNYSTEDFKKAIVKIADNYKPKWTEFLTDNEKNARTALYQVVNETGLFQLVDNSHEWIMKMKK